MTTRYVTSHGRRIKVKILDLGGKPSKARQREASAFVQVPLKWLAAVSKITLSQKTVIASILLCYLAWRAEGSAFECPNAIFERYGVSRKAKQLALLELEAAGLIAVKRRGLRAPIVTLLAARSGLATV